MQTPLRWLKTLREQRLDGLKDFVNSVSIAQTIMLTAFLWLKIVLNSVSLDQTLCKQRFDGSKHSVNRGSMAQNIMLTAFRWLKRLREQR